MKRSDGLIICDYHKRGEQDGEVIDDGITILQDYIEYTKRGLYQLHSDDPNNTSDQIGILKNRKVDDNGNNLISKLNLYLEPSYAPIIDTHFCNKTCFINYNKWI